MGLILEALEPNLGIEPVHHLTPAILNPDAPATRMDLEAPPELVRALMCSCPSEWIDIEDAGR